MYFRYSIISLFLFFISVSFQSKEDNNARLYALIIERIKQAENTDDYTLLEETIKQFEDRLENTDLLALLYHKLGATYFNSDLEYNALEPYKKALNIRRKILKPYDFELAKTIQGYGRTLSRVRRLEEALVLLEENLKIREKTLSPNSDSIAEALMILAGSNTERGNYEKAIVLNKKAISIFKVNNRDLYRMSYAYQYLGVSYQYAKEYYRAIQSYEFAIRLMIITNDTKGISECSHNIGETLAEQGKYKEALPYFQDAQKNYPHSEYLNNIAKNYLHLYQYPQAHQYIQKALDFAQKKPSLCYYYVPRIYVTLGDIYEAEGNSSEAVRAYNQAVALFLNEAPTHDLKSKGVDPLSIISLSPQAASCRPDLLKVLRKKGDALNQLYKETHNPEYLKVALDNYQKCDGLLRDMLQSFSEENSRFFWTENVKDIYEKGIRTALALQNNDAALAFAESSRAFNLLTELQNNKAKHFGGVPDALLTQERELKANVAFWQKISFDPSVDSNRMAQSREGLLKAKQDFETFQKDLEKKYPNYFKLKYQSTQFLTIRDLQQKLGENMAIVQYHMGDSSLFIFSISKSKSYVLEKPLTPQLFKEINDLRQVTGDYKYIKEKADSAQMRYLHSARVLYQTLLEEALNPLGTVNRLRLIPDGALSYVPFELLLTANATNWRGDNTPWLLRQMAVSYAYSNRLLESDEPSTNSAFGGYGISYETDKFFFSETEKQNDKITPLKHTVEEVKNIQSLLGGQTWLDQTATKKAFINQAGNQGIIHLAMHGYIDPKDPLNSGVIFSRENKADSTNYLTGYDLYTMELKSQLAVLSACNTGDGLLRGREGVISLARSFAFAGCRSLIMSLWSVSDKTTSDIMIQFYENLKKGLPKDVALQQAKLHHLQTAEPSRRIPNTWAAMILTGDIEPLVLKSWWQSYTLWIGLALGISLIVRLYKKKK